MKFLYNKTVQILYCHSAVPILQNGRVTLLKQCRSYIKRVKLLYCHSSVPILQNVTVTVLSQCSTYTTKPSSCCIVTVQILYNKTVVLLYCHRAIPILQNGQVTVLSQDSFHTKNGPITVLYQCISYTTKRSSYCIVTLHFLY